MRKNKKITNSIRLVYLEKYFQSPLSRYQFEKEKHIAYRCISRWLRNFGFEDKSSPLKPRVMKKPEPTLAEQELRERIYSLEQLLKSLKLELKQSNIARDAYNCMIDLTEATYNIRVQKTQMPSSQIPVTERIRSFRNGALWITWYLTSGIL